MYLCPKCKSEYNEIYQIEFHNIYECPNCNYQKIVRIEECCRNPFKIVIIDRTKRVERLLYQCKNCGGIVNRSLPLSFKKYGGEIRDELNGYRFEEWKENINNDYLSVKEQTDENNFRYSKRGKYLEYLASEKWKIKRQFIFERDNFKCQNCKEKNADEVHHLTYDRLFNEDLDDLISMCTDCHRQLHDNLREKQWEEIKSKIDNNDYR